MACYNAGKKLLPESDRVGALTLAPHRTVRQERPIVQVIVLKDLL